MYGMDSEKYYYEHNLNASYGIYSSRILYDIMIQCDDEKEIVSQT